MQAARKRRDLARGVRLRVDVRGVGSLDMAAAALRNQISLPLSSFTCTLVFMTR